MAPDLMTRAGDDGRTWPYCSREHGGQMKSVRVATLRGYGEGEECGIQCGVPFFTLHRLDPGRAFFTRD